LDAADMATSLQKFLRCMVRLLVIVLLG
jgi:hypothetical protein